MEIEGGGGPTIPFQGFDGGVGGCECGGYRRHGDTPQLRTERTGLRVLHSGGGVHSEFHPDVSLGAHLVLVFHPSLVVRHVSQQPHVRTWSLRNSGAVWDSGVQGRIVCAGGAGRWPCRDCRFERADRGEEEGGPHVPVPEQGSSYASQRAYLGGAHGCEQQFEVPES